MPKRIVHVAKTVDLFYKLVNSGLLIDEHLMHMLSESDEEEVEEGVTINVYENLLSVAEFVLGLRNSEMSFQLVAVIRKHLLYVKDLGEGIEVYMKDSRLKQLLALS